MELQIEDIEMEPHKHSEFTNHPLNHKIITNKITDSDIGMEKQGGRRVKVRTRLSEFADYTTTHGLGHIKRVEHPLHKIFWIVCLLVSVSYFGYQVVTLVTRYRSKDYTVLIDVKFDRQLKFPAVTLCNLNPIRYGLFIIFLKPDYPNHVVDKPLSQIIKLFRGRTHKDS